MNEYRRDYLCPDEIKRFFTTFAVFTSRYDCIQCLCWQCELVTRRGVSSRNRWVSRKLFFCAGLPRSWGDLSVTLRTNRKQLTIYVMERCTKEVSIWSTEKKFARLFGVELDNLLSAKFEMYDPCPWHAFKEHQKWCTRNEAPNLALNALTAIIR